MSHVIVALLALVTTDRAAGQGIGPPGAYAQVAVPGFVKPPQPPEVVEVAFVRLGGMVKLHLKELRTVFSVRNESGYAVEYQPWADNKPGLTFAAMAYGASRVVIRDYQGRTEVFLVIVEPPELPPGGAGR